jgi:dTDP-4-amino-4,6-dideoxygalactose transaminase
MNNFLSKVTSIVSSPSPSKWGGGTGLLWRGNTFSCYCRALLAGLLKKDTDEEKLVDGFLFESCRVAIYHFSKSIGLMPGDQVQVMGFTCDAVTDALQALGCDVVLYDCNDRMRCPDFEILKDTKLIICQVSFGVRGLSNEILCEATDRGIVVLLDKSLSYGIEDFDQFSGLDYPTVMSFEVSKSITIGWGGLLRFPESHNQDVFRDYYDALDTVSIIDDMSRIFKTTINLLMVSKGSRYSFWLWLFLRGLGCHRASVLSSGAKYRKRSTMGSLSKKILGEHLSEIPRLLEQSNLNHERIASALNSLGIRVISKVNVQCSSPRVVFLISNDVKMQLAHWLDRDHIELGLWFDYVPILKANHGNRKMEGTLALMEKVANLPCHYSISTLEIDRVILSLEHFFSEVPCE